MQRPWTVVVSLGVRVSSALHRTELRTELTAMASSPTLLIGRAAEHPLTL